MLSSKDL
ncbi:uncharacterized protein FFE2_11820 [Fusarium fujikuroi]|nr:uncharacterized protein FFE2_11820 [Fusarium fujikuroi]